MELLLLPGCVSRPDPATIFAVKIYTYFDSTPMLPGQGELIKLWAKSWTDHGWEPHILHPRTAVRHPRRREFNSWLEPFSPLVRAKLARWLAVDAADALWSCDYDVINVGFTSGIARAVPASPNGFLADTDWCIWRTTRPARRRIVKSVWGGTGGTWRRPADLLVHFSTVGVLERHGPGVTKAEAILRYYAS